MERYLIEVICFQTLFLGFYWLFFRKSTFFKTHRAYLLVAPVLSIVIPFIKISAFQTVVPEAISAVFLPEVVVGSHAIDSKIVASPVMESQWSLLWIYYPGVAISLLLFVSKIYKLRRFLKLRRASERIIEIPESTEAFTFLNYIFIGEEIDALSRKHVLAHEYIHVQQSHTWDLLAFEVLRIVMWFNPLVYVYQREIARVHEYLADQAALSQTTKQDYYEKLLNTAFGTSNLSFTNTFYNHPSIKNRIVMLQKSKSAKTEVFKYALIIPMVLGMLFYVSCSENKEDNAQNDTEVMKEIRELSEAIMRKGNLTEDEVLALKFLSTEAKEGDRIYLSVDEFVQEQKAKGANLKGEYGLESGKDGVEVVNLDNGEVPFSQVDQVPIYSGCEALTTNEERKKCMTEKMDKHISENFNTTIGDEIGLVGVQRIYSLFKIDKSGNIVDVKARAPHPSLQEEAIRVISSLPKMESGAIHQGRLVTVSYTKPIMFKIEE